MGQCCLNYWAWGRFITILRGWVGFVLVTGGSVVVGAWGLVEKIIFGFKKRRRVIENGLKQVKLGNNSGFPVSFERWMKFYQK